MGKLVLHFRVLANKIKNIRLQNYLKILILSLIFFRYGTIIENHKNIKNTILYIKNANISIHLLKISSIDGYLFLNYDKIRKLILSKTSFAYKF